MGKDTTSTCFPLLSKIYYQKTVQVTDLVGFYSFGSITILIKDNPQHVVVTTSWFPCIQNYLLNMMYFMTFASLITEEQLISLCRGNTRGGDRYSNSNSRTSPSPKFLPQRDCVALQSNQRQAWQLYPHGENCCHLSLACGWHSLSQILKNCEQALTRKNLHIQGRIFWQKPQFDMVGKNSTEKASSQAIEESEKSSCYDF